MFLLCWASTSSNGQLFILQRFIDVRNLRKCIRSRSNQYAFTCIFCVLKTSSSKTVSWDKTSFDTKNLIRDIDGLNMVAQTDWLSYLASSSSSSSSSSSQVCVDSYHVMMIGFFRLPGPVFVLRLLFFPFFPLTFYGLLTPHTDYEHGGSRSFLAFRFSRNTSRNHVVQILLHELKNSFDIFIVLHQKG